MSALDPFASTDDLNSLLADTNLTVSEGAAELDLAAASQAIRRFAGWHIAPELTHTVRLHRTTGPLFLPSLHVTELLSITNDGVVVDVSTLAFDPDTGELDQPRALWRGWSTRRGSVVVTFTHGYGDVPADIKRLCLEMVIRSRAAPTSMTREQTMSSSASPSLTAPGVAGGIALLPHEEQVVNSYRIRV